MQEIRQEALQIASRYDEGHRDEYLEAAQVLRFPYWDWASDEAAANGTSQANLRRTQSRSDSVSDFTRSTSTFN